MLTKNLKAMYPTYNLTHFEVKQNRETKNWHLNARTAEAYDTLQPSEVWGNLGSDIKQVLYVLLYKEAELVKLLKRRANKARKLNQQQRQRGI